jgi:hypothetical protein
MNSVNADDPRCPECGEPIGITAAYCMHCSADLTEERKQADADEDWRGTSRSSSTPQAPGPTEDTASLLDPDGLLDNSLTAVVGLIGGFVIGLIGSFVVATVVSFGWGIAAGILVWLGATTYLVRHRTVQETVSKAAYGIAIAIISISLIVFSPTWDTGNRLLDFAILVVICVFPAAIVGGVGFLAGRFVPTSGLEG